MGACLQTSIESNSFDGCSTLERITMRSTRPLDCRVDQGLLDGTTTKVYVPPETLFPYRTDYFWSVYASSILPDG